MKIEEGYMPFMGYQTYYRIVGEPSKEKKPLLLLHGGPGSTHNYFEVLDRLAETGRQIISYDQIGCGNSYLYGWGPNEYVPTGSLGDFEYIDRLGEITTPCLLFSGTEDLCTPAVARSMYEGIPGSRWELMQGARHMCFVDRHEDYCRILEEWLEEKD